MGFTKFILALFLFVNCPIIFASTTQPQCEEVFASLSNQPVSGTPSEEKRISRIKRLLGFAATPYRLYRSVENRIAPFVQDEASPAFHSPHETGMFRRTVRFAEDLLNPTLRFMFPGLLNRLDGPTRGIFRRQWRDPEYQPTPQERAILEKYHALEAFERRREFLLRHPYWARSRRYLGNIVDVLFKAIWLAAFNNMAQQLSGDTGAISDQQYLDDDKNKPQDDEVQLLIESVPFPHMAIRIGDRVYSYGMTHLSVTSAAEYVRSRDLADLLAHVPHDTPDEVKGSSVSEAFGSAFKDVPRTIQVVTLKVGKEKRDQVKRYLELNAWKKYHNDTFVNDCSTMTLRSLGMENRLIDPSPSGAAMVFSLRKTLGDGAVKNVFMVTDKRASSVPLLAARNTYIGAFEAALNVRLSPFSQPKRLFIDSTFSDDDFQKHTEAAKKIIGSWRDEVDAKIRDNPRIKMDFEFAEQFRGFKGDNETKANLRKMIQEQIESDFAQFIHEAQEGVDNPEATLRSYWVSKHQLDLLPSYKKRLSELLGP